MGDDERTRRIVLSICAVATLALLLVLARIAAADWAPRGDDDSDRPVKVAVDRSHSDEVRAAAARGLSPSLVSSDDPSSHSFTAAAGLRGNPAQFFGPDAYPPEAIRANEQGRTVARLTVDATGIPTACAIITSSGSRSLDAATCAIAIGKVRYTPAQDSEGRSITSQATLPVRWVLPR